jgi:hypothetical protein
MLISQHVQVRQNKTYLIITNNELENSFYKCLLGIFLTFPSNDVGSGSARKSRTAGKAASAVILIFKSSQPVTHSSMCSLYKCFLKFDVLVVMPNEAMACEELDL